MKCAETLGGRLLAIARRERPRAPMQLLDAVLVTQERGVEGDHKGLKFRNRAVTVLGEEDWAAALASLPEPVDATALPWTTRRANLLVAGVRLPRARGALLQIGTVRLEVTYPTVPCRRMEQARAGLQKALYPEWRGGITARVLEGGTLRLGDPVMVLSSPPETTVRLPG